MLNVFFSLFLSFAHSKEVRIVSLAPHLTEIIFELNLDSNLVGASSFSNYPEAAKKLPSVGSYLQPNIEKIIRLNPTHVLVAREGTSQIEAQLKKSKIPYFVFDSKSLKDYPKTLRSLAEIFNIDASAALKDWEGQLKKLKIFKDKKIKTLIQLDHNPIVVAGSDTFLSEAFSLCGLKNVIQSPGYNRVNTESIINKHPELVIVVGQLNSSVSYQEVRNFYKNTDIFSNIRILKGDADRLSRLSKRFLPEVFSICSQVVYERV